MENKNENIPKVVKQAIKILADWCELHPTCEGCGFSKKHIGCQFRRRSPKEYNKII